MLAAGRHRVPAPVFMAAAGNMAAHLCEYLTAAMLPEGKMQPGKQSAEDVAFAQRRSRLVRKTSKPKRNCSGGYGSGEWPACIKHLRINVLYFLTPEPWHLSRYTKTGLRNRET